MKIETSTLLWSEGAYLFSTIVPREGMGFARWESGDMPDNALELMEQALKRHEEMKR